MTLSTWQMALVPFTCNGLNISIFRNVLLNTQKYSSPDNLGGGPAGENVKSI